MRRVLFCLTVLIPLACDEYNPSTDDGAGGVKSTVKSATGGSSAAEGSSPFGGNADTAAIATANAGKSAVDAAGNQATAGSYAVGGSAGATSGTSAGGTESVAGASFGSPSSAGASAMAFNCGLPTAAAGSSGVARPSGTVGGFKVIDWAGFKGAVSFTFDDGNSSQLDNYRTLMSLGVRYTFFLMGMNATSNKAKWQQAVADGNELGNHTQYHVQGDPIASDVAAGQQTIESTYNVKSYTMAAPFGNDYTSIAPSYHFLNRGVSNGLMKPNSDAEAFDTWCFIPELDAKTAAFDAEVNEARAGNGWKVILVHGFAGDSSAYKPVDIDQFKQAVLNAKAPGDLWIDTFANVGAYWRGQAAVSKVQPTTSGSDQTWNWTLPEHFPPGKCLRVRVTGGTLKQNGNVLPWNEHGYYEMSLDAGSVTLSP